MIITIKKGQILIDGQPTTDAEFIGFALLDFAETTNDDSIGIELRDKDVFVSINRLDVKEKYLNYIKTNGLRMTTERLWLLDLLITFDDFNSTEFVKAGMKLNVSYPTCYNFLESCVDAKIIYLKPKLYSFIK